MRETGPGVEMVRRNMSAGLRLAFAALQDGRFAAARDAAGPMRADAAGALLHALGRAGAGDVAGGAAALHGIARANPAARHPVHDLADLLVRHGRGGEAPAHLRAAAAHDPGNAEVLAALGAALAEAGPVGEAVEAFQAVAALRPEEPAGWSNLGKALAAGGRFAEAEAAFARMGPPDAQLGLNHAVARLKSGRLEAGWPLFRARHGLPGRAPPLPGEELRSLAGVAGRTVLLVHDEGFGDTLQFVRYAPLLAGPGARGFVRAPAPLRRLLAAQGIEVVSALPRYDAWCRIPDLPGVFGTGLGSIPAALPYVAADPGLVALWSRRLPAGRRVGLVWAGAGRAHAAAAAAVDRVRSIPDGLLGPLLAVPGVAWVSLQHGRGAPAGVFDPMPEVADFADTAAIVAGLDLVVSVDTAVAHLAGAMGRRVLLLDRYDNCWRWLSGREDSPWYPGVLRILRQGSPGDWRGVLARAAAAVAL